jgi:hypothetical protein
MAIVNLKPKYAEGNVRNKNSNTKTVITSDPSYNTQKSLNLYINDTKTRETFNDFVGTTNPIWAAAQESDGSISDQKDHFYEFINKYKVCEIVRVTSEGCPDIAAASWGNWRNITSVKVPDNVFLFPDQKVFSFSYSNKISSAWEKLTSGGILSKISQFNEMARSVAALVAPNEAGKGSANAAGKFVSPYVKAPAWDSTDPIQMPSNIKFNFNFGQAGLFSGEHEVVRPILALALLWVPLPGGADNYFNGIVPTPPHYLINFFVNLAKEGVTAAQETIKGFTEGGVVDTLTNLESQIINLQSKTIKDTLNGNSRFLCIRMGRMKYGPLIVKDVNWDFDFTQTDEYGFPYKGSITFGGLESIQMAQSGHVTQLF